MVSAARQRRLPARGVGAGTIGAAAVASRLLGLDAKAAAHALAIAASEASGLKENFGTMVKDVDAFVRHISEHHGFALKNMIVLAHSVGAVSVAAWVHDYAPPIRAMILATPAFRVRLYVPLAIPSLRLKQKFLGPGYVKSYVKAKMLTHDPVQAALYDADPLIFRQIAVNVLIALHDAGTRLLADAGITIGFDVHDVVANDEHAVALVHIHVTNAAGTRYDQQQVQVWHMRDGRCHEYWAMNEDQAVLDVLLG